MIPGSPPRTRIAHSDDLVVKRIINLGHDLSLRASQDMEIETLAELMSSRDLPKAIQSYLEKRRPRFTGE